jgi:hypothetical protein
MEENGRSGPLRRAGAALAGGGKAALRSLLRLAAILLPLTVAMGLLDWCGAIRFLDRFLGPVTGFFGLPGSSVLALAAAAFVDIYAGVLVMAFLSLDMRAAVILAVICLAAHSLIAETAAMKKSGSSATKMVLLRLVCGLAAGWGTHLILAPGFGEAAFSTALGLGVTPLPRIPGAWGLRAGALSLDIVLVVMAVGALRILLGEFGGMTFLSRVLAPFMRFLGLDPTDSLYWVSANVAGYPYCAGLLTGDIESGKIKRQDGDLFNHNALFCHALVEDTAFFMVLGLPLFWLVIPRLVMATALTWIERIRRRYVRRSFRAGVA